MLSSFLDFGHLREQKSFIQDGKEYKYRAMMVYKYWDSITLFLLSNLVFFLTTLSSLIVADKTEGLDSRETGIGERPEGESRQRRLPLGDCRSEGTE
jgi:hypothetical protein